MNEKIFALDIGTRSVVGIIMEKNGSSYRVADMITKEHEERSMLDGQIHDVLSVSQVIQDVKKELEERHGALTKVCVAAAGRALRTHRTSIKRAIHNHPLMTYDDVSHLELSAVQQAQYEMALDAADTKSTDYYCVGYSVLHYYLDEQPIGSLIDQQGKEATIEIIATFLPKVVVESLISALQRADLQMDALTLEPIAAIQVLIPPSMRRLNVALVDIGAGTSDIAITDEGTVTAYGMVPVAGDEITEAISDAYLLDFPLAEAAKRQVTEHGHAMMTDILGFETEVSYETLVEQIEPSIDFLANRIGDEILLMNGKTPKAVMLVGGGSQTPDLAKRLAKKLNLPDNRVAIRGIDAIQGLEDKDHLPQGPDFVTPVGIAIAAKQNPVHYISVEVNDRAIRLFDMKSLTVGDSLLSAGIDLSHLYGKPGQAYMITVNGSTIPLKGSFGKRPTLTLNNEQASLETPIRHGDSVQVEQGMDGSPPTVTAEDLIGDMTTLDITFNERRYSLSAPAVLINGKIAKRDQYIQDHDQVEHFELKTIGDLNKLLQKIGDQELESSSPPSLWVNCTSFPWPYDANTILRNGSAADLTTLIQDGDSIHYQPQGKAPYAEVLQLLGFQVDERVDVFFEGQPVELKKHRIRVTRDEEVLSEDDYIGPGDQITTEDLDTNPFIFQDVFLYVDIELSQVPRPFELYRNGQQTSFHEPIHPGDQLKIDAPQRV